MKIAPRSQLAAIRFGGLAFAIIVLWAWFRPIGYAWSEHAGIVFDGLLALVSGTLALAQIWRYKRDLRKGGHDAR